MIPNVPYRRTVVMIFYIKKFYSLKIIFQKYVFQTIHMTSKLASLVVNYIGLKLTIWKATHIKWL